MQKLLFWSFIFLFSLTLPGCTALKKQNDCAIIPEEACLGPRCAKPKPECLTLSVEDELLITARSIEEHLNTLAAAQKAESEPILNTAPLVTPEGGMGGLIDIDWTGPIGPLTDKIARLTGYRIKFLGREPAIPILVTVTVRRGIIAEVLQNASLQAGKRAQVLVYPSNRVIEVRYLS